MSTTPTTDVDPLALERTPTRKWLGRGALLLVAVAAVLGWGASFLDLHDFAVQTMSGYDWYTGWLVPATFNGAAFSCTLVTYRASIHGRMAFRGRVLMWLFTGASSWINWVHQEQAQSHLLTWAMPIAAVAIFEIVLFALRADHARLRRQLTRSHGVSTEDRVAQAPQFIEATELTR